MFPKYQTIDTLKVSRSKFRFNSNRLDYIAKYLGLGGKIKTEFGLWKEILINNNAKALGFMIKYCKGDVQLLEDVFDALKPHIEPSTHYGVINEESRGSCPECGSHRLVKQRTLTTKTGLLRIRLHCFDCRRYCTKTLR